MKFLFWSTGSIYPYIVLKSGTGGGTTPPAENTFFVRSGGSDSADGSTATPWATIAHGLSEIGPGDTLLIGNGTWTTPFTISNSGTSGNPITIKAENQHQAFISVDAYAAIIVGGNYVTIDGLRITNYSRHGIEGQYNHHMTVKNCLIEDCGGNGIGALQGDFYHFEDNISRRNGRTGWNSGISIYQPDHRISNDEVTIGTERNVIRGNIVNNNQTLSFMDFDTGTVEIVVGDTLTIDDLVIGRVDRVELTSGSWGAGTAAGRVGIFRDIYIAEPPADNTPILVGAVQSALTTGGTYYTDEGLFTDGNGIILDDWSHAQDTRLYLEFDTGGTTALANGNVITVGDWTATIDNVVLESGSWAAGTAAGRIGVFVSVTGTGPADNTPIQVGGVTRALVNGADGFVHYGYPFGVLVEENLSYLNGGKGIQFYGVTDGVANHNTAWHNNRDGAQITEMTWRGEITGQDSAPTLTNNIAIADISVDSNIGTIGLWQVAGASLAGNITWMGLGGEDGINTNTTWTDSGDNQLGVDPWLVDPENEDFRVASNSAAVNAGTDSTTIGAISTLGPEYVAPARGVITDVGTIQITTYGTAANTTVPGITGLQEGDVVYAYESMYRGFDAFLLAVTPPTGFEQVADHLVGLANAAGWISMRVWRKVLEADDPLIDTNPTFTHASAPRQYIMQAFRGVDTSQPEDTAFAATTGTLTVREWADLTTFTDNARLVALGVDFGSGAVPAGLPAIGMTERADVPITYLADMDIPTPTTTTGLTNHANSGGTGENTQPNGTLIFAVRAALA